MLAPASKKVFKSFAETRHSFPILYPRNKPFLSHWTLVSDLQAFDPKPVARNSDLRGGRNADLVLALAVALWWGDRLTWNDDVGRRRYEPRETRASHWSS